MTGFGKIYNVSSNDINSYVDFFSVSDSATHVENSYTGLYSTYYPFSKFPGFPLGCFSDDAGEREYAIVSGGLVLSIYTIDFNAQTVTFSSSTSFTITSSSHMMYAIKKVGTDYCIYYIVASGVAGSASVAFRKITVTPGGGYIDTLLQDYTTSDDGFVSNYSILDNVFYLAVTGIAGGVTHHVYIYTMDISSESISGGLAYTGTGISSGAYVNPEIAFAYSNGSMNWIMGFVRAVSSYVTQAYAVINGTESLIYTDTTYHSAPTWGTVLSVSQYNRRDSIVDILYGNTFGTQSIGNPIVEVLVQNAYSYSYGVPHLPPIYPSAAAFDSRTQYPAIIHSYTDDLFYLVNTSTGQSTGTQVLPTGVSKIYDIYPKMDDNDSTIYMNVKLTNNSYQTIGVDPSTFTIVHTFPSTFTLDDYGVSLYSRGTTNHGNFFIQWIEYSTTNVRGNTKTNITYIFGNPGSAIIVYNNVVSILEMN